LTNKKTTKEKKGGKGRKKQNKKPAIENNSVHDPTQGKAHWFLSIYHTIKVAFVKLL